MDRQANLETRTKRDRSRTVSQVNDRSNTEPISHGNCNSLINIAKLILTLRPGKPLMPVPPTGPCETSQQHPKYTGQDTYSTAHSSFPRLHWKYCKCDFMFSRANIWDDKASEHTFVWTPKINQSRLISNLYHWPLKKNLQCSVLSG